MVLGSIAVAVTTETLPQLLALLHDWSRRGPERRLRILGEETIALDSTAGIPNREELLALAQKLTREDPKS